MLAPLLRMNPPRQGMLAPLKSLPGHGPESLGAAHALVSAVLEGDVETAARHFDQDVCSWWTSGGRTVLIEGAHALSVALVGLVDGDPPTRVEIRSTGSATSVATSRVDDQLRWSLELNVVRGLIIGAYIRRVHDANVLSRRVRG